VGPVHARLDSSEERFSRGSSARDSRKGVSKAKALEGQRRLLLQNEDTARARGRCPYVVVSAEVCKPPSGSEKRATCAGPVESRSAAKERANGSLTDSIPGPRKRTERCRQKEGGSSRSGNPHHVNAATRRRSHGVRSSFGSCSLACGGCRWKASRIGKSHAFHEAPAEPVLAASGSTLGSALKRAARRSRKRRRQGCQRRAETDPRGGRQRLPASTGRSPK